VAPLNWGLGHATRCIPIINALLNCEFEPIIASDGVALKLLQKEFPKLTCIELPSYKITYSKKASHFKLKIIKDSPTILKAIKKEQKKVKQIIEKYAITGIISDNRFGVRSKKIPSVFITHQLNVLSGNTTWFSSKLHQKLIAKFDECWVPDFKDKINLSGKLGHLEDSKLTLKYLGPLSRFKRLEGETQYDLMVLLSGPEPQRTYLEQLLLEHLKHDSRKVLFVKGKVEEQLTKQILGNTTIYNFMTSFELEKAINSSKLILSRSGYTTIMDLAKLGKKAFFIPTPGQYEQEYLARRLHELKIAPFSSQKDFTLDKLDLIDNFKGFEAAIQDELSCKLFSLF